MAGASHHVRLKRCTFVCVPWLSARHGKQTGGPGNKVCGVACSNKQLYQSGSARHDKESGESVHAIAIINTRLECRDKCQKNWKLFWERSRCSTQRNAKLKPRVCATETAVYTEPCLSCRPRATIVEAF